MEVTLFTPYDKQKEIIDQFADSPHKFGIAACGRQVGKSLLGQNLMIYWLLSDNASKGAIISPIYNQSKKIFNELTEAANEVIQEKNKADLTIKFVNGSTLQFLGAERYDSIRGFSFNYMFIDEAAYIKEEAINNAILPTLTAIGKKCFIASTPKSKNWFYRYYTNGLGGNDNYISFAFSSFESPYCDDAFLREQERSLPEAIFRQEFWAEFTDAGQDVFKNLNEICILNNFQNTNNGERCFIGADIGISNDYTSLCIINDTGRVLFMERFNGKPTTEISQRIIQLSRQYKITGGYIETNGIGRGVYDQVVATFRKIKAWNTTQDNKSTMVRKLIEDIETRTVELPSEKLFPYLYREMSMYTYKLTTNGKITFTHPQGHNDDTVDSLLLANEARHTLQTRGIYVGRNTKDVNVSFGIQ
jgi:hypothetical protein